MNAIHCSNLTHAITGRQQLHELILITSRSTPENPVMSEVSINVSHGTTFIYGTQAGPSNPVDLLGQWR